MFGIVSHFISCGNFRPHESSIARTTEDTVSQACRKRRLIGAVCRNHCIKRLVPCRCLDGHVKESYEMSMASGARP